MVNVRGRGRGRPRLIMDRRIVSPPPEQENPPFENEKESREDIPHQERQQGRQNEGHQERRNEENPRNQGEPARNAIDPVQQFIEMMRSIFQNNAGLVNPLLNQPQQAVVNQPTKKVTFKQFSDIKPPTFYGHEGPTGAQN